MEELQTSWDLSELYSTFYVNHITDFETLEELLTTAPEETQREIIPSVGLRLRLNKKFKDYISHRKQIDEEIDLAQNSGYDLIPITTGCSDISEKLSDIDIKNLPITYINTHPFHNAVSEQNVGFPQRKRRRESKFCNFDLKKLLSDHPIGKELLTISKQKKISLEAQWISILCEIIVLDCLSNNIILVNEDLEELAFKIVDLFPAECVQTFYVPPVKKKDSIRKVSEISKGKLVDKYRNTLTIIRNIQKVSEIYNINCESEYTSIDNGENSALNSKEWLKHHREELDVLFHWKSSFELRRSEVDSSKIGIINFW